MMQYRREYIGRLHPEYQGSGFTEVLIYDSNNEIVEHYTGPNAREEATAFFKRQHAGENVVQLNRGSVRAG